MTDRVISWQTTKTLDGFAWTVYSFGFRVHDIILKAGLCRTRAQATGRAKVWMKYFKANARNAA